MDKVETMDPAQIIELEAFSHQKEITVAMQKGDSKIQDFYEEATVFVTGGSGFLGKQLIEKLFRSTKLKRLFVLIRPRKGKAIEERFDAVLKDPIFDGLCEHCPQFRSKITLVEGDVADIRLGLSDKDWTMITDEVELVFHMAATTRFDETLRVATLINVRGTREMLLLAKDCRKLRSFVYVSTAYSHATDVRIGQSVNEQFYPSPIPAQTLIEMVENLQDEKLNNISQALIVGWPNTYSFTKAVAEEQILKIGDGLPICVVRPAIVINAYREPLPGWLDISSIFGAVGLLFSYCLGIMHVYLSHPKPNLGIVPVDFVTNSIITAGWDTVQRRANGDADTKIFNVSLVPRNPISWGSITEYVASFGHIVSIPATLWYCFGFRTNNKLMFFILSWFFHFIPAYIIDGICFVIGKKRRFVRLYTKIYKMNLALSYFMLHEWLFKDDNLEELYNKLSPTDKILYNFDMLSVDYCDYITLWSIGIRKYIIKDGLVGTETAMRRQSWFKILHLVVMPLYVYSLWKLCNFFFFVVMFIFNML